MRKTTKAELMWPSGSHFDQKLKILARKATTRRAQRPQRSKAHYNEPKFVSIWTFSSIYRRGVLRDYTANDHQHQNTPGGRLRCSLLHEVSQNKAETSSQLNKHFSHQSWTHCVVSTEDASEDCDLFSNWACDQFLATFEVWECVSVTRARVIISLQVMPSHCVKLISYT